MAEENENSSLSRREPGENRGHRLAAPLRRPQLSDAVVQRTLAAMRAGSAEGPAGPAEAQAAPGPPSPPLPAVATAAAVAEATSRAAAAAAASAASAAAAVATAPARHGLSRRRRRSADKPARSRPEAGSPASTPNVAEPPATPPPASPGRAARPELPRRGRPADSTTPARPEPAGPAAAPPAADPGSAPRRAAYARPEYTGPEYASPRYLQPDYDEPEHDVAAYAGTDYAEPAALAPPLGFAPDAADATQPIPVISRALLEAMGVTDAPAAPRPPAAAPAEPPAPAAAAAAAPAPPDTAPPATAPQTEPAEAGDAAPAAGRRAHATSESPPDAGSRLAEHTAAARAAAPSPAASAAPAPDPAPAASPAAPASPSGRTGSPAAAPVTRPPGGRQPKKARPEAAGTRPGRRRRMSARRRDRIAAVSVIVVAVLAGGSAAIHVFGNNSGPPARAAVGQAAVRNTVATWMAGQVSRTAVISCDPAMCTALRSHGFRDLMELTSGGSTLLRSAVVVATSAIRQEVGSALTSVYAPDLLARFGTGAGQIDIRTVARDGAAKYQRQLSADERERRESGSELLTSTRIVVAPMARVQLTSGQVDSRILLTIAALAARRPVKILAFHNSGPGAATGPSPLRSVDVTQVPGGEQLTRAAFVRTTLGFLKAQQPPFYASGVQEIRLPDGGTVVRVIFSAPSPLGLLLSPTVGPSGG